MTDPRPRMRMLRTTDFLGRNTLLRRLATDAKTQRPVHLMGPRRSGKTWALAALVEKLDGPVVHLDCNEIGSFSPRAFYQCLRDGLRDNHPDGELFEVHKEDDDRTGRELVEFVRDVGGVHFVLDEFERVITSERCTEAFLGQLRTVANHVSFTVATCRRLNEVCHVDTRASTFWSIFTTRRVEPWPKDELENAMKTWLGRALERGAVTEAHRLSGGWPVVAATIAERLIPHSTIALAQVQACEPALCEAFDSDVANALANADHQAPGARTAFLSAAPKLEKSMQRALYDHGLVKARSSAEPSWPWARDLHSTTTGRRAAVFHAGPPDAVEWRYLVTIIEAEVPASVPVRVRTALTAVIDATGPVDAWAGARHLQETLFDWLRTRHPDLDMAKLRTMGGNGGRISALAKMVSMLRDAGNFGCHHNGQSIDPAAAAAVQLLAVRAVVRTATWMANVDESN